jgi:hypothetical protein
MPPLGRIAFVMMIGWTGLLDGKTVRGAPSSAKVTFEHS